MTDLRQALSALGPVAVLAGGDSAEREVSLKSGQAVYEGLKESGANVTLIDPSESNLDLLKQFSVCFIALHGRGGEDGVIQGALQHMNIPFTGSGVMASALGMDKVRTKWLWQAADLPTPDFYIAGVNDQPMPFPLMVKPAHEGSSIGMHKVDSEDQLAAALADSGQYDSQVLVERWVNGEEYTVAILGDTPLPVIRLETPNSFYDYDAKYVANSTQYHCPCGLTESEEIELQQLALKAFQVVGCEGWGRVDVMRDEDGFQLLEVNTVPGMTDHSLVPMAAKAAGMDFPELVSKILLLAGGGHE